MRRKGKCIECRHCKKEALLCIITSKDCAGVYTLTVNDLYNEDYCDYFEKIEEKENKCEPGMWVPGGGFDEFR